MEAPRARWIVMWFVAATACGAALPPPSDSPRAVVRVASETCPRGREAASRLQRVLAERGAARSDIAVEVRARGDAAAERTLTLRVVRGDGEIGLERAYTLGARDCASAIGLLALSLERFLTSFPEWGAPPRPPSRTTAVAVNAAVNSIWSPAGVEGQLAVLADVGGARGRLGGSIVARASVPQRAGRGRFQQTAALAGLSARRRLGAWELRSELRGGAILVTGLGFADPDSDWLPWWELVAFAGREFSWGSVGLELAGSPLRHRAVTRDGTVSESIPLLRLGLAGSFAVVSKKP